MKKFLVPIVCILSLLFFTACSENETNASEKAISIATRAVNVADQYLDGTLDGETAYDLIDGYYDDMSYVDSMSQNTDEERKQHTADFCIQIDVSSLASDVLGDRIYGDSESYNNVIESRNNLAEDAGLEKR
ncbi:MAG: hypothetical protein LUC25_07070 [Ruminococcus sp.]|nr:hypothetical protein [Ruminococcus sp.]